MKSDVKKKFFALLLMALNFVVFSNVGIPVLGMIGVIIGRQYGYCGGFPDFQTCLPSEGKSLSLLQGGIGWPT